MQTFSSPITRTMTPPLTDPFRLLFRPLLAAALLAATALAQEGDVVFLHNGDQLTGTVKSVDADHVVLVSPVFGETKLPLQHVRDLRTDSRIPVVLKDGTRIEGAIQSLADGRVTLDGGAGVDVASMANEQELIEQQYPKWSGAVSVGGTYATGNTERRTANAQAEVKRRAKDDRITLGGSWDYSEDRDQVANDWRITQRRLGGRGKYDWFLGKRSYLLGTVSGENDKFQDLDLRFTGGAGYGYQFAESKEFSLSAEAGISYFDEQRKVGPDSEYVAARVAYSLSYLPREDLALLQDTEAFPSLEDSSDVFVRVDSRARLTLTGAMFAQAQWVLDYDNTPAPGLDRLDHRFLVSFGWSF
jgi:putative salt-induced outer membrane protein YdiY